MFDPTAMGTLLIGLNLDEAEPQTNQRRAPAAAPGRAHAARMALASAFRRVAALLEPRAFGELADDRRVR
jgi:hypothetical protein